LEFKASFEHYYSKHHIYGIWNRIPAGCHFLLSKICYPLYINSY
jgi:hypothetical protein